MNDLRIRDLGIVVSVEDDDFKAGIESATLEYSAGRTDSARAYLEELLASVDNACESDGAWLMLFDLYRIQDQRAAHQALAQRYAQRFLKQPPVLDGESKSETSPVNTAFQLGAELVSGKLELLINLTKALRVNDRVTIDFVRVKKVDAEGCAALMALIATAKRRRTSVEVRAGETIGSLIRKLIAADTLPTEMVWRLQFELLRLLKKRAEFDELADRFISTFHASPAAWEDPSPLIAEIRRPVHGMRTQARVVLGSMVTELTTQRELGANDPVVIDFDSVSRIDFAAAVSIIHFCNQRLLEGRSVMIRNANLLVISLLRIGGLVAGERTFFS